MFAPKEACAILEIVIDADGDGDVSRCNGNPIDHVYPQNGKERASVPLSPSCTLSAILDPVTHVRGSFNSQSKVNL